ncbi:MAG: GH36-type glycosyl hydrolase domain-containing protein [Eubacteriales bacterium]
MEELSKRKSYGHFENDGKTFVITDVETPRHWYNYFFNDEYVSFTSQVGFGEGIAQDSMGRRIFLLSGRNVFLKSDKKAWSLFGLPIGYGYTDYSCAHENGASNISLTYDGVRSNVRIFVPNEGKCEIWSVTAENLSDTERELSLIAYAKTEMDGVYRPQGYNLARGGFIAEKNAVYGHSYDTFESERNRDIWGYMSSSETAESFDSRRNAFIGPYGDDQHPKAISSMSGCHGSDCNSEKLCFALENKITLAPNGKKTIHFVIGAALSTDEIITPDDTFADVEFSKMKEKYNNVLSGVEIKTPMEDLDNLVNGWLKYAADMGSRWARVRHNGFRDLTSDTECFACVDPSLAWERIKRILTFQYENGYAPRTVIDGAIRDRNFADNTVWLASAVDTIIKELGKKELLFEEVKFNNGSTASVYEHIRRSVDFLYNFQGLYGLIRIWGGDWNDCVNYAGLEGKGVSVWLSIAWCYANRRFRSLALMLGKEDDVKLSLERGKIMEERIEKYGRDEKAGYYIYARTDDDIIMGSDECEEGKIFLISQLWSVFAGLPHAKEAMDKAEEILETPIGIRLAYPAFSHQYDYIGSMAEKEPGVQDNGGIYLHPSAWKLAVDSILRRPDRVEEGIKKMLPGNDEYGGEKCGEPYAMFNSYFAPETGYRAGTPGQSWRTASSSWMLKSMIEYVFGMHAEMEGLRICPCLPLSWKEASIKKIFRGCVYDIHFVCDGTGCDVVRMTVNGEEVSYKDNIVPAQPGKTLKIEVSLS